MEGEIQVSDATVSSTDVTRHPTHRCKVCGAMWILYPPNSFAPEGHPVRESWWSLGTNEHCGPCCDNVAMGEQIERLADAYPLLRERAYFRPQRSDPATWVLHLLANEEISVSKAREWLRHYIQDGKQDPLPDVEALP